MKISMIFDESDLMNRNKFSVNRSFCKMTLKLSRSAFFNVKNAYLHEKHPISCAQPTPDTHQPQDHILTRPFRVVPPLTKLHRIKKYPQPIWAGVPFMKKVQILKLLSLGRPARFFGPFFTGCGPKSKFHFQHFFASSSIFRKGMT